MKVCYVYQDEYPWDIRVEKIVTSLAENGIDTHVLSRNRSGRARHERATQRLHYHWLPAGWGSISRNLLNFPAFFSPVWLLETVRLIRREDIDLLIVRDLPLGPMALMAARFTGRKVIMDMAEDYPAMIRDTWTFRGPGPVDFLIRNPALLSAMERWLLPRLDGLLVVSEASGARVRALPGMTAPVWVVGNTPRLAPPTEADQHPIAGTIRKRNCPTIVYVGGLEESRGLQVVIESLGILKERLPDVLLVIVGSGTSEAQLRAAASDAGVSENVLFVGWVPFKLVPSIISAADICIVPHYATAHTHTTVPNKIFDYMAQAKPVVVSDARSLREIVESAGCGKVYRDKDPQDLARAVCELLEPGVAYAMGQSGHAAVQARYNWTCDERVLLSSMKAFARQNG